MEMRLPIMKARTARGSIMVNGRDILASVAAENILSFSYTDNTSDKADDLSVSVADPHRTWMQTYLPQKGIECEALIVITDWNAPFDSRTLRCGTFYIDEVHMSGPPNVVDLKATSIPTNQGLKNEKKNRSWEAANLQGQASQIASENGLELFYDTSKNPEVKRTDQCDKADLEYIRERAKENSLSIKIHDKKLVVYSEEEYEARPAAFMLIYGRSNIVHYEFNSKCDDTYDSAENSYVNPETGKLTKTDFSPDKPPEGVNSTLKLNERVEFRKDGGADYQGMLRLRLKPKTTPADYDFTNDLPAQNAGKGEGTKEESLKKCKAKLREKNKKEKAAAIRTVGNISYLSGLTVQLIDFGIFSDKYFIESSIHSIVGEGYETDLRLRTTLEGY
jgi:uncharacterized protein